MARISKRTVDAQKPPTKGDRIVWDDELRGFGLRVRLLAHRTCFADRCDPRWCGVDPCKAADLGASEVDGSRD